MRLRAVSSRLVTLVCLAGLVQPSQCHAISIRHDVAVGTYNDLALQSEYSAAGYIADSFGEFCSGALVSPTQVLTASHCVDDDADGEIDEGVDLADTAFGFEANVPSNISRNVSSVAIHPNWVSTGGASDFDVAVLTLSSPITDVTPARITDRDPSGLVATMIGYGDQGTGTSFPSQIPEANGRLAAQNIVDEWSGVVLTDFDSPTSNTSTLGSANPIAIEGTTGPGDSGGPLYVEFDGVSLIVGTLSGGINEIPGGIDSGYGDVSEWAALRNSQNLSFLAGFGVVPFAPAAGDFDLDADVDGQDFLVWQRTTPTNASNLTTWKNNYGEPTGALTIVPEPSSLVLVILNGLVLFSRPVRKRMAIS